MSLPPHHPPNGVHDLVGHEGVPLFVAEYGTPGGAPIVLIHGYSQCHLSWARQFTGPLADEHRLIVPDLRGHGRSGKPDLPAAYDSATPWAYDIAAIIDQLNLTAPILVGWSMGGKVIGDYVRLFGDDAVSGIALLGSSITSGKYQPESAIAHARAAPDVVAKGMYSQDLDVNLRSTADFLRACTANPLPADEAAWMLGFNMLCPPHIRAACRQRHEDYRLDFAKVTKPALIVAGAHERIFVPELVEECQTALPHAQTLIFANSGHSTFWEEPDRFNTDLAAFAAICQPDSL